MKSLSAKLADRLEVNGWDLVLEHTQDLEWWADEIWELKSRWTPLGGSAFITFLVDPMWEGNRRRGEGVWAVGCSPHFPINREAAAQAHTLTIRASKDEIEEFVDVVDGLRRLCGNV